MRFSRFAVFILLVAIWATMGCKREYHNPYDPDTPADLWMPENLETVIVNRNAVRLTWQQREMRIDGFEVIKDVAGERSIYSITKDSLQFTDMVVVDPSALDTCHTVVYSIKARAGDNRSMSIGKTLDIPYVSKVNIIVQSQIGGEITLSATPPQSGETGKWSVTTGDQNILSSEVNNPIITVLPEPGIYYILRWTITGVCGDEHFDEQNLNIAAAITIPTVITTAITSINQNSAIGGGDVTSDGGSEVSARGICWSTIPNPSINGNIGFTEDGTGTGSFTSSINILVPNTTYYVRAFATNADGTAYGLNESFTTSGEVGQIGEVYQGGIIAYFLQPNDPGYDPDVPHGIIAAPIDIASGAHWGCHGTAIQSTENGIGTGYVNTSAIVLGCSESGFAAKICLDVVINDYSDWYLPSIDELEQLYINLHLSGLGGFQTGGGGYWSSTESSANGAWRLGFTGGNGSEGNKNNSHRVRAVRSF